MLRIGVQLLAVCAALVFGTVAAARVLPRGGELSFLSVRDGNYEIYLLDVDRTLPYNLTRSRSRDDTPAWSPDGRWLAFVSYRSGGAQIYVADVQTGNLQPMTDATWNSVSPAWSPDSRQIAFISSQGGVPAVYVLDADCSPDCVGSARQLPVRFPHGRGSLGKPDWSPDGRYLALAVALPNGNSAVGLIDVTNGDLRPMSSELIDTRLVWSSDSRSIAFTSVGDRDLEVYTLDAADGLQTDLSRHVGYDGIPAWSPDGAHIAFESSREGGMVEIYQMNRDGSDIQRLTGGGPNMRPAWSPDGTQIAFESPKGGSYDIYVMDVSGQNIRRLTTYPADDRFAAWRPG